MLGFKATLAGAPAQAPASAVTVPANRSGGDFYLGSMTREQARINSGKNLETALATLYRDLNLTPAQNDGDQVTWHYRPKGAFGGCSAIEAGVPDSAVVDASDGAVE